MVAETCSQPAFSWASRQLSESGQGILIIFSCACMFININIQWYSDLSRTFCRPAPLKQNTCTRIHFCRCHCDNKSRAWVLERLPYETRSADVTHIVKVPEIPAWFLTSFTITVCITWYLRRKWLLLKLCITWAPFRLLDFMYNFFWYHWKASMLGALCMGWVSVKFEVLCKGFQVTWV